MNKIDNYGQIIYDEQGLPVCHICGKSFRKLLTHVWQKHNLDKIEYKKKFGLDTTKGIACQETKELLRKAVKENYDKVVTANLLSNGTNTRFSVGGQGRTKDKVSYQTYMQLNKRIKTIGKGRTTEK